MVVIAEPTVYVLLPFIDTMLVNNAAHIAITIASVTKNIAALINAFIISDNFCV